MNKSYSLLLIIVVTSFLSGCGGAPKSAGNNKWLDFGNGMINLSNVTYITLEDYAVKFDNFTLTLSQVEYTEKEKEILQEFYSEKGSGYETPVGKQARKIQDSAVERAKEEAKDDISRIIDFINSTRSYMKM